MMLKKQNSAVMVDFTCFIQFEFLESKISDQYITMTWGVISNDMCFLVVI